MLRRRTQRVGLIVLLSVGVIIPVAAAKSFKDSTAGVTGVSGLALRCKQIEW